MSESYGMIYKSFEMKKTNALLWVIYFKDSDTENAIWVGLAGRIREDSNSLYFYMTLGWWSGHLNVMKFLCCFPFKTSSFHILSRGKKQTRLTPIFKSKQLRIMISCSQQETMLSQQTQTQRLTLCLEMGEGKRKEGKSKEGTSFSVCLHNRREK